MSQVNALHYCMLTCIEKLGEDRSVYATYHLLKGKKSSQTMQDAKLYHVSEYFRVFPHLTRDGYDIHLRHLEEKKYIHPVQNQIGIITKDGKEKLQQENIPKVNGLLYHEISNVLWKRLVLIIQTLSHLQKNEKIFRPIVQDMDITIWVKNFFLTSPYSKKELAQNMYQECCEYLRTRTEQDATIFVWKLTGRKRIGYTDEQIAEKLKIDPWTLHFLFQSVLHGLLSNIQQYPFLQQICPVLETNIISDTARKTYQFLQQGFSIEKISQIRRLKQNTIEDHVVEIALSNSSIPIDEFVSKERQEEIKAVYEQKKTRKLRELKEELGESCTYFQIRLVLAKVERR